MGRRSNVASRIPDRNRSLATATAERSDSRAVKLPGENHEHVCFARWPPRFGRAAHSLAPPPPSNTRRSRSRSSSRWRRAASPTSRRARSRRSSARPASPPWWRTAPARVARSAPTPRRSRRPTATPSTWVSTPRSRSCRISTKLPYDPAKDFLPIVFVATSPNVLIVHPSVPAKIAAGAGRLHQGQSRQAELRLAGARQLRRISPASSSSNCTTSTSRTCTIAAPRRRCRISWPATSR